MEYEMQPCLQAPTFWPQIPKLYLLPRKGPGHPVSFSSTVLLGEDRLSVP